ncbi:MAG TPA: alpha/beta fold hydrolase [Candidatus Limnocylindria bacterium]
MTRSIRASAPSRTQRRVSAGGLSYEIHGEGPDCLTLHGGPGMSSALWPALGPLARRARLVVYDHRGHGLSRGSVPQREPLESLADDAAALIRELGLRKPAVLGHSNGGFIALHLALRHPSLVGKLVLVDTAASAAFRPVSRENARRRATPRILRALATLWNDTLPDDAAFERAWVTVQPLYFHRPSRARIAAVTSPLRYRLAARRRIFASYDRYDLRDRLESIRVPTLVIVGRDDWITPPEFARELAAGIRGARMAVFDRSGHNTFVEEPRRFAAVVGEFLAH